MASAMQSLDHIRHSIGAVIRQLAEHPEKGRSPDRPATAVIEEGLRCRIEGPEGWTVVTDMPQPLGGGGAAPTPGWLSRAAQASCLATVIAMRAAQEGVALARLEVTVESESDARGLLDVDPSIPPGPFASRTRVRIAADGVAPERLRELVWWGDAHSPVSDLVGRAIPRAIDVEIG